jgi:hypothetical protein
LAQEELLNALLGLLLEAKSVLPASEAVETVGEPQVEIKHVVIAFQLDQPSVLAAPFVRLQVQQHLAFR